MRTVRPCWRLPAMAAALVLPLMASACTSSGSTSSAPTTRPPMATTAAPRPTLRPGDRLDGSNLPVPVSNLRVVDDRLVYLAATAETSLELVAVDPDTATVAWRVPAGLSYQPSGVGLWIDGNDTDTWVLDAEPAAADRGEMWLVSIRSDGSERWRRHVLAPTENADSCGARVCIETEGYLLSVDAEDGTHAAKGRAAKGRRSVASSDDGNLTVELGAESYDPGIDVALLDAGQSKVLWTRPLAEVFGRADLTPDSGWLAERLDAGAWVVNLGAIGLAGRKPTFPYHDPTGGTAAVSAAGDLLWRRPQADLCPDLLSHRAVVFCDGERLYPTEDGRGTWMVKTFEQVDPIDGHTRLRVDLHEPVDLFSPEGRLLAAGPDRWLLVDDGAVRVVDLVSSTVVPAARDERVGWCSQEAQVSLRSLDGEVREYRTAPRLEPCALAGFDRSRAELASDVADGTLAIPDHPSVERIRRWAVWVEDDELTGVVVA